MLGSSHDFRSTVLFYEIELLLEFSAENDTVGFCMTTGIGCCSTLRPVCRFVGVNGYGTQRTLPE